MTKSPKTDTVGDDKSPPLQPSPVALRHAPDQAMRMVAEPSQKLQLQSAQANLALAAQQLSRQPPSPSCQQRLWLSFFFDGTGNNLDADVGTGKHSNVAKLYSVHPKNDAVQGVYRIYIPGVGTYFKEVGDDGGSALGLGTGRLGDARLDWALTQFDEKLRPHVARATSPANCIVEINIALYGFSRGAALARAFSNKLLKERCVKVANKGWCLKNGQHRLRIRFMGIFDTVASVGLPMSTNTVSKVAALFGVEQMIQQRLAHPDYSASRPQALAFAKVAVPGADPAPGVYDGHQDWGGMMNIPHMVEEVRHFVAAHEMRNSFPVDSISTMVDGRVDKPAHFHESVFPGVHSDVGGSYRPGEGGRTGIAKEKLGLIPLHKMYQLSLDAGVPLLVKTAWSSLNAADFSLGQTLLDRYNYYQSKVGAMNNLGPLLNAHMALYFAWRFRAIRRKQQGNRDEANKIAAFDQKFKSETALLDKEVASLERIHSSAKAALVEARERKFSYLQSNYANPQLQDLPKYDEQITIAERNQDRAEDNYLRAKARRDAQPDMGKLTTLTDFYDAQLISDAKAIREVYTARGMFGGAPDSARRKELRPHYKVLIDAYENEFIHNKGLSDETIIAFFDDYVHDSLAGFAKDATLPSDPRVVYLGGDEKYKYASLNRPGASGGVQYASTDKAQARDGAENQAEHYS